MRPDSGKCLHYYFYFIDATLGLIYLRVPTWWAFRLQFYCNGHSWLARQLAAEDIGFTLADNAFHRIDDWQRAQELADAFSPDQLNRVLDHYAEQCCPVSGVFGQSYHWRLMQVEYATDLAFRSSVTLGLLYDQLIRESVFSVKAAQLATFLGRQITPQLAQEIGSRFSTRIEGTCVKHRFGKFLDQDVRQGRHRAAHRDHDQRCVVFQAPPKGGTPQRPRHPRQRWLAKFGQADKWKICLRAARVPHIRSDNGETSTTDAQSGFQGEGGAGCHQGREDAGRVGAAV